MLDSQELYEKSFGYQMVEGLHKQVLISQFQFLFADFRLTRFLFADFRLKIYSVSDGRGVARTSFEIFNSCNFLLLILGLQGFYLLISG